MNRSILFLAITIAALGSCTEKKFVAGDDLKVVFSHDTVYFDTVFTSLGTVTRELRIINPYKGWLTIDRIYLASGDDSNFRLNIDGVPGPSASRIELPPNDSIFIFVDAIIDPNNSNSPVAVTDSIVIVIKNVVQDVNLLAWGQDIHLINGKIISSETWGDDKPYVIYNSMLLDTGHLLTITAGARVLFHRGSTMYIAGQLSVEGTRDRPVRFGSDRYEEIYEDVPGQWTGLYFINSSNGNSIDYAIIENATSGIHLGNLGSQDPPPDLQLSNSIIRHMSVSGISSIGASINAWNCVVYHCGFYCLFLSAGGSYSFTHCTVFNQWDYSLRLTPAMAISDYIEYDKIIYHGTLAEASFRNSIVFGNLASEVGIFPLEESVPLDIKFRSSLVKVNATDPAWNDYDLSTCIISVDPLFINPGKYDFRPDTLSPVLNSADLTIGAEYPLDLRKFSRLLDTGPDIGAYERQIGEISNKW